MTRKETTFLKKYNTRALDLLHNKYVLFFIIFIAILNLCGFVYTVDVKSVCVFVLSGIMTSFFSENMVVILVVAMVVANIIRQHPNLEGFKKKKGGMMKKMKPKGNKKKQKKPPPEPECDEDDDECIESKDEKESKSTLKRQQEEEEEETNEYE
jgi:hypothetical protein